MSWLNRLFGKKTAPVEPWSFPYRIDGLADSLALTVFEHETPSLTNEEEATGRMTAEALSGYMDGLEREFVKQCGAGPERVQIFIRVELRPGQPARVVGQGDLDEARIADLIARVAPPAVTGGSVAFECRLTTPPDPSSN